MNGSSFRLEYDAENRLVAVSSERSAVSFAYDGDGNPVKSTINGVTTYFVGNYYEVSGSTATKYYYAGTSRVAMNMNGSVYYLLSDQLGSTSKTVHAVTGATTELRYDAWGEVRYTDGVTATDYTYTGQYSQMDDVGLMFYNARWYDPSLNRWTQPDSIVPDLYNPQDWDRYSYALNNPVRYADPSGHDVCDHQKDCDPREKLININRNIVLHKKLRDFKPPKTVSDDEMITVGIWPFLDQVSPDEYRLMLDSNGNLDYVVLFKMYQLQQDALGTAQQLVPGTMHNDPGDAFRHAYWNALMTREFGSQFASAYGDAHETGAVPSDYQGNEAAEQFMDLHNNQIGIGISAANPGATDQVLQQKVMQALRAGQLYVWDGQEIYYSNECPVCVFH